MIAVLFFNFSKTIKYPFSGDKRKREVKGEEEAHPRISKPEVGSGNSVRTLYVPHTLIRIIQSRWPL